MPSYLIGELHATLGKMEIALGSITDSLVMADAGGRVQWCNRSFDRLVGQTHIGLLGQKLADLLPLERQGRSVPPEEHPVDHPRDTTHPYEFWQGDRKLVLEISKAAVPLQDAGKILLIRDVTERVQMDRQLRKTSGWVKLLQEVALTANEAETTDKTMQKTLAQICAQTRWPVGHVYLVGESPSQPMVSTNLWHLEDPEKFRVFREVTERTPLEMGRGLPGRVWATGKAAWITDVTRDANFPRAQEAKDIGVKAAFGFPVWVGANVVAVLEFFSPAAAEPDESLLAIMSQIGVQLGRAVERHRAKEELVRQNGIMQSLLEDLHESGESLKLRGDELERSNQELGSFAYAVSHDLKAPLRGIDSLIQWIMEDSRDQLDEEGKKRLMKMQARVRKMHALIDGILEYSRIGRVKEDIEELDLNKTILEIVELLGPPSHFQIKIQKNLPVIHGEKTRIHQLFQNLLSNAVKHNDKPQGQIKVGCEEDGAFWRFSISDNGLGIDEKYHERIFGLFQTLGSTEKTDNTGVGLSLVKKIVHLYGGRVWVNSKLGEGSRFYFTYPKNIDGKQGGGIRRN